MCIVLDCKTVSIFAYSCTREQSNKRSGTRLKTESETWGETLKIQHTTFTSCQNNCFLCRVDYALEENVLTVEQMCVILRGRDTHTDFLWSAWFALWCKSIFFFCFFKKCKVLHRRWLTVLGCLIFPKGLLVLHNSKRFSLCPWMWLFPARFCHAGPGSLPFSAGRLNSHG